MPFYYKEIKPSKISIHGNNSHVGSITPLRPINLKKKQNRPITQFGIPKKLTPKSQAKFKPPFFSLKNVSCE